MPSVLAYHRPGSLEEASTLLAGPNRTVIGGGTVVVPRARMERGDGVEVVDLQALGLDSIEVDGDRLVIGAMVTLGQLAQDDRVPELLRELARRELPSALRTQATVGGTVGQADWESVLLAGLLVHDAEVRHHAGAATPLDRRLGASATTEIITEVSVAVSGAGTIAATGRTPADTPIVAAVARDTEAEVRLALTGVAATPVLVDSTAPVAGLTPPADFRGSSGYRAHLADVLARRAVGEVSR